MTKTPTPFQSAILNAAIASGLYDANSGLDIRQCDLMVAAGWLEKGEVDGVSGYLITDAGRAAGV
jgi:hypothetical protein